MIILRRSDKQPDRVEISPEQLMGATEKAEVRNNLYNSGVYSVQEFHTLEAFIRTSLAKYENLWNTVMKGHPKSHPAQFNVSTI